MPARPGVYPTKTLPTSDDISKRQFDAKTGMPPAALRPAASGNRLWLSRRWCCCSCRQQATSVGASSERSIATGRPSLPVPGRNLHPRHWIPSNSPPSLPAQGALKPRRDQSPHPTEPDQDRPAAEGQDQGQGVGQSPVVPTTIIAPPPQTAMIKPAPPRALAGRARTTTKAGTFQDCPYCPQMIEVPLGSIQMGSRGEEPTEQPPHEVAIKRRFAIGVLEVTYGEWMACVNDKGCKYGPELPSPTDRSPMRDVSWADAVQYIEWSEPPTSLTGCRPRPNGSMSRVRISRPGTGGETNPAWCTLTARDAAATGIREAPANPARFRRTPSASTI